MKKLMTVMVLGLVLAANRPAPAAVKPNVPDGICQWCWWCLECYLLPVAPTTATSVDFEMQQQFNPF